MTALPRSESERKMAKKFDRVGIRDQRIANVESHEISDLSKTYCPTCSVGPLDGVTGATMTDSDEPIGHEEKRRRVFPDDGSPTVCSYCGELLVFRIVSNAFTLAYPTEAELNAFKADFQGWRLISGLQEEMKQKALEARLRGDRRYAKSKTKRF